jgi:hypothetical protein
VQRLLEEYYALDYEDDVGGLRTRFRYKEVRSPPGVWALNINLYVLGLWGPWGAWFWIQPLGTLKNSEGERIPPVGERIPPVGVPRARVHVGAASCSTRSALSARVCARPEACCRGCGAGQAPAAAMGASSPRRNVPSRMPSRPHSPPPLVPSTTLGLSGFQCSRVLGLDTLKL